MLTLYTYDTKKYFLPKTMVMTSLTPTRSVSIYDWTRLHCTLKSQTYIGIRVQPDISISLDGWAPGSSRTFAKVENIHAERGTLIYIFIGSHVVAL